MLLGLRFAPVAHASTIINVTFINPEEPGSTFWPDLTSVMKTAAHELGIRLTVVKAGYWPTETEDMVRRLVQGPQRPDYLIITSHRNIGARVFIIAEQAKVPFFVVDAGLPEKDRRRYGGPRQHFKYWLGQMLPNHEKAGYDLANILIDHALRTRRHDRKGRVRMVAMSGIPSDYASTQREKGLMRAVGERSDAELLQVVPSDWFFSQSASKTRLIIKRYPNVSFLWASNDKIALDASEAIVGVGRKPDRDILVGGIDWSHHGLEAVGDEKILTTIGGHVMDGAWALVLLYDYHHGIDFAKDRVDWRSEMIPITKGNLQRYSNLLDRKWDRIDFRAFSKKCNPGLKHYRFTAESLLSQQKNTNLAGENHRNIQSTGHDHQVASGVGNGIDG